MVQLLMMYRYNSAPIRYTDTPESQIYSTFGSEDDARALSALESELTHEGLQKDVHSHHRSSHAGCSERLGTCYGGYG